jgi:hypothetical protein
MYMQLMEELYFIIADDPFNCIWGAWTLQEKKMHEAHLAKSYSNGYLGSFGKRATLSLTCAFSFKREISHITLIKEISANSILTSSGSFFPLLVVSWNPSVNKF